MFFGLISSFLASLVFLIFGQILTQITLVSPQENDVFLYVMLEFFGAIGFFDIWPNFNPNNFGVPEEK